MTKAMTPKDRDHYGYVYAYQHFDPKKTEDVHIKVGRTIDLKQRFDRGKSQCGKKIQRLGWWLHSSSSDEAIANGYVSARYHCIIERIVLIELNDIEAHSLHLLPGYPDKVKRGLPPSYVRLEKDQCDHEPCGMRHIEIFSFRQHNDDRVPDKFPTREWPDVVWPIIDRWGQFAKLYLEGEALLN